MGRKTVVHVFDDVDPTQEATDCIEISLDGETYRLDLSADHAEELRADVGRWTQYGERLSPPKRRGRNKGRARTDAAPKITPAQGREIRAMARQDGKYVSDRGRLPSDVVLEYYPRLGATIA